MCVARFRYVSGELAQPLPASLQEGIQARHSAIGWSRARRPGCSIFAASVYAPSGGRPALGAAHPDLRASLPPLPQFNRSSPFSINLNILFAPSVGGIRVGAILALPPIKVR